MKQWEGTLKSAVAKMVRDGIVEHTVVDGEPGIRLTEVDVKQSDANEGFSGDELVETEKAKYSGVRHHAKKQNIDRSVIDLARERVEEAFKLFDTVAVSFSGGKDSTVCLHLALDAARARGQRLIAFHYDEEAISFETEQYVRRVYQDNPDLDLWWLCLPIQHRNACTRKDPYWYPWAPEDEAKWVRPMPPEGITFDKIEGFPAERKKRPSMPDSVPLLFPSHKYGRVGMIMGIRADESLTRTRAILKKHADTRAYIRPWADKPGEKLWKVYPIYDWRTQDVWTAPNQFGWDYNRSYDLMEMAGMSHKDQRCAPPYGEEPLQGLWTYACCFPDIWDKMSNRVPGAATAARYSQTQLYSFGKQPPKPADMTWPEYIRYWIDKHPQPYKGEIANRVRTWIENHYSKTTDLIAPKAPHPITGISWMFLLNIAIRGDYKDRRQPNMGAPAEKYEADIKAVPVKELIW